MLPVMPKYLSIQFVIDCVPSTEKITEAINKGLSDEFQTKLNSVENPYGSDGASRRIVDLLKTIDLEGILKKDFYNL